MRVVISPIVVSPESSHGCHLAVKVFSNVPICFIPPWNDATPLLQCVKHEARVTPLSVAPATDVLAARGRCKPSHPCITTSHSPFRHQRQNPLTSRGDVESILKPQTAPLRHRPPLPFLAAQYSVKGTSEALEVIAGWSCTKANASFIFRQAIPKYSCLLGAHWNTSTTCCRRLVVSVIVVTNPRTANYGWGQATWHVLLSPYCPPCSG